MNWLLLIIVVITIDLVSKFLVLENFALGEIVSLFPSLNLRYVRNYGMAFGLFSDENNNWQRWFFVLVSFFISIFFLLLISRLDTLRKTKKFACAMIIGGAIGNLLDRIWHGFVVDMIDFYIGDWHFAIFNFADCAISFGTALYFIL